MEKSCFVLYCFFSLNFSGSLLPRSSIIGLAQLQTLLEFLEISNQNGAEYSEVKLCDLENYSFLQMLEYSSMMDGLASNMYHFLFLSM